MKRIYPSLAVISCIFLSRVCAYSAVSPTAITCDPWVARMVSVQGNVEVSRANQTQWQPARLNDTYCTGDRIQVGERSRANVALVNQPIIRLDQNTTITFGGVREERTSLIELLRGALYFFSRLAAEPGGAYRLRQCRCGRDRRVGESRSGQDLHIDIRRESAGYEPGRKSHAYQRSVGSRRTRKSPHINCGGASSRCRPMGVVLSTRSFFALRNFPRAPVGKGWFEAPSRLT